MQRDNSDGQPPRDVSHSPQSTPERCSLLSSCQHCTTSRDPVKTQSSSSSEDDNELTVIEVSQSTIMKPPDGGWGWMIVLGCFLMNVIVNGISYSFGVIFVELLDKFNRTSADIAWVYSLNCVICSWLGPVATALGNAFTFRVVAVFGGLIYGIGLISSSFVTELEQLYLTYGLISGFGAALTYGPSIIMVGRYFDKRRALANGLAMAGSGVGSFVIPPFLHFLIGHYGFNGGLFILGALSFHLCFAGCMYRPLPFKPTAFEPTQFDEVPSSDPGHVADQVMHDSNAKPLKPNSSSRSICEMYETALYPTRGAGGIVLGSSLLSIPENIVTVEQRPTRSRRLSRKTMGKSIRRVFLFLCAWPRHLRNGIDFGRLFDFSLLRDGLFLTFSLAAMFSSFGYLSMYLILPAHALDIGLSKSESVFLVSIVGICDLFGRVAFGWCSDCICIPRKWGFCFMIFMASACVALSMVFGTTYILLASFAGCFGLFAGAFMVLNPVLTADLFGLERLPSAFGLLITIQGVAYLVGPPIVAGMRDYTGGYTAAFLLITIVMACGGCLLPLESLLGIYLREDCLSSQHKEKCLRSQSSSCCFSQRKKN